MKYKIVSLLHDWSTGLWYHSQEAMKRFGYSQQQAEGATMFLWRFQTAMELRLMRIGFPGNRFEVRWDQKWPGVFVIDGPLH